MAEAEPSSGLPEAMSDPAGQASPQARPASRGSQDQGSLLRPVVQEVVEELHMAMRSGPLPHPLLEKITPDHIDRLLAAEERDSELFQERYKLRVQERKEKSKLQAERQRLLLEARKERDSIQVRSLSVLAGLILLLVFALCWLFLAYGQAQYIVTVISSLFAFAGGIGVGRWTARPEASPKEPPEPAK